MKETKELILPLDADVVEVLEKPEYKGWNFVYKTLATVVTLEREIPDESPIKPFVLDEIARLKKQGLNDAQIMELCRLRSEQRAKVAAEIQRNLDELSREEQDLEPPSPKASANQSPPVHLGPASAEEDDLNSYN